eukprot:12216893-Heterocapsa_arctica.AAC.1
MPPPAHTAWPVGPQGWALCWDLASPSWLGMGTLRLHQLRSSTTLATTSPPTRATSERRGMYENLGDNPGGLAASGPCGSGELLGEVTILFR